MKVRVSRPVSTWLEGSQAWAERDWPDSPEEPADLSLMRKVAAAPARKDGSVTVDLTDAEVDALRLRADWLADCAADGIEPPQWGGDNSALAELNAARGLMRQIDRLRSGGAASAPVVTLGPPRFVAPVSGIEVVEVGPLGEPVDEGDEPVLNRRLRVYRAEDKAAANAPAEPLDGTVKAAQRYVDRIVRSAWWKRTCPPYSDALNGTWPVVKVEVVEGRQGGGYCFYAVGWVDRPRRGVKMTLRLGRGDLHGCPAIADPWVILHEMAHCLAVRAGHRGHGREFARCYLLAVGRWLGPEHARALRAGYADEGMKYRAR